MVVPRSRLLLWCGVALPFTAIPALIPSILLPCIGVLAVFVFIIVLDAAGAPQLLRGLKFQTPEIVRLTKDREGDFLITIFNPDLKEKTFRVALPFPAEVESEQEDISVRIPASQPASVVSWHCRGVIRGHFKVDRIYYEAHSALKLWNARSSAPIQMEIYVYPNLSQDRKQVASLFLNRGAVGIHSRRIIGQGREFEKLREYIHGDSYDQIHWKATAKRGKPVTKIFQVERTQEVYIAIDSSRLSARLVDSEAILEHHLRAALVLGMVAERQGDLFGLLTFSDKVDGFLRARNGKPHYSACRELLTTLHPRLVTPDFDDLFSFLRMRLRRRALIIILTDLNDPVLAERFVQGSNLIARQHLLLVDMVRPPGSKMLFSQPDADSVDSLYDRLAGHMLLHDTMELKNTLHRHGVTLALLDDSRLTADLVSQYLTIKQRQQI
jgi:uncharacterized protein (DUF58 family)